MKVCLVDFYSSILLAGSGSVHRIGTDQDLVPAGNLNTDLPGTGTLGIARKLNSWLVKLEVL